MTKRYANLALIYAAAAMAFGVFYREFAKFSGFSGETRLSVMHTHYFLLGMIFFLILLLIEKSFGFSSEKHVGKLIITYNIGLNITGIGLFIRGLTQILAEDISKGLDASISGVSGIGHIIMGVSLILLLLKIKKSADVKHND